MDLTLTTSQAAFRDGLRSWLATNPPGAEPTGESERFEFRRRWQQRLHAGGYVGLTWPTEFGGAGLTLAEKAIFNEEITRTGAPELPNFVGVEMAGPVLLKRGTDDQRRRLLPAILSADEIWAQGFSEPDAGSDLASLKTRAHHDGDGWVVTGQKVWTSNAHRAQRCLLLARTDPAATRHHGLTFFILDLEQEGVSVRPLQQITGERHFNELFLDGARIPDANVVGTIGDGWSVAITTLMHERAGTGFFYAVKLRKTFSLLVEECRRRGAFSDASLRQRIAQLHIESECVHLTALRALTTEIRDGAPGPEGSLTKWHFSEVNQAVTELAVDVLGPEALEEGSPWAHRFLHARGDSIAGGTTEIQKDIIAQRVLGLPRMRR